MIIRGESATGGGSEQPKRSSRGHQGASGGERRTLQQRPVGEPDPQQGVVVLPPLPLLVLLPHGLGPQHGVLLQQVTPDKPGGRLV